MVTTEEVARKPSAPGFGYPAVALLLILVAAVGATLIRNHDSPSSTNGSGVAVTQRRDLAPATSLELTGACNLTVRVGGPQTVIVRADDNLVDRVTTRVRSGTLLIGTRGAFATKVPMTVGVVVPVLVATTLSGSGTVVVEDVAGGHLSVRVPGSGTLRASGTIDRLDVVLSGSGDVQLADLVSREVIARVEGAGRILVHATSSLNATVSGAGAIANVGTPDRLVRNITGAGSITVQ